MENPAANQLPEVDSMPDGFVDSTAEPLAPSTPSADQENPVADYKEEKLVELDSNGFQLNEGKDEDNTEPRNFPAEAPGNVSCHAQNSEEVFKKEFIERGDAALVVPETVNFVSEDAVKNSKDGLAGSANGEDTSKGTYQSSEKSVEGGMNSQEDHVKGIPSSEGSENSKKVETSEVKRKSTKRTFKSEKEFLEFTLKYQQVLTERDTAIVVRDKLESLCRELQRQNKMLMDECKRVSTEGQNLRLDLSNKFQDAIKEVGIKLEEQKYDYLSQQKENEMLQNKLKQLADQYTLTEQQFNQMLKQKSLELQIADLRIQQHEEKLVQEQSQMKLYAEQVSQLLATEKNLRIQLTADGEKFQQFQDALVKSNEVFETFKQEIEKMAKSIKELKKDNTFLKSKSEKSDITLIELVEEREHLKKQLEKTKNQKEKLESLCRSLQAERKKNPAVENSSDSIPI